MITDERQRRAAKAQVERLEQALGRNKASAAQLDPRLRSAVREGIQSQIDELLGELAELDRLRGSTLEDLELASLDELSLLLIRARVVQGLSQRDLARRLGVKEQQIQRYESTNYRSASLRRVLKIGQALGIELQEPARLRQTEIPWSSR